MDERKYWIWLAFLNPGAKTFYRLLAKYGSIAAFYDAVAAGHVQEDTELARLARASCCRQRLNEMLCELSAKNISVITRLDDDYPAALARIPWPPPVLFVKGRLPRADVNVGIVGTRRCTRRGWEFTRSLAGGLRGVCVVSGLARGIDAAAHLGALDADVSTVAVLGCGPDVTYPPENEKLYRRIVEKGAIISELPPGTAPLMGNFPVRNRIIAGLSRGLIVVESERRGGTAITASLAVQYGRDVFAVPGSPYLSVSEMPNALIAAGAVPVSGAADLCAHYGLAPARKEPDAAPPLDAKQTRIYEALRREDLGAEGVAARTGLSPDEVSAALTMMELAGVIRRLPGGRYAV